MRANGGDDTLRDYLLGGLSEDAKEQIERQLMTEDGEFEQLLIEVDGLVDDYVGDGLSERDRLRFESHFLCTPERRMKLRFAATLRDYLHAHWKTAPKKSATDEKPGLIKSFWNRLFKFVPHPTPTWGTVAAALTLVVALGVSSMVGHFRIQDQLDQVSTERQALLQERETLQQQLAVERARTEVLTSTVERQLAAERARAEERIPTSERRLAVEGALEEEQAPAAASLRPPQLLTSPENLSFSLSPGVFREGGELARIRIPSDANWVMLQLDIGLDEYRRYRAVLHRAEGDEVWAQGNLRARTVSTGAMVVVTLPSQLLTPGDYYMTLLGVGDDGANEGLGRYDFRVIPE